LPSTPTGCSAGRRTMFGVEALFPATIIIRAFAHETREDGQMQHEPIDEIGRETQRLMEIDKQHDARLRGAVPGLMLVRIIKDECFALLPVTDLSADPNGQLVARFRHDQAEVQSQDPLYGPRCGLRYLPGSKMENMTVIRPGILRMIRHVSGHSAIACSEVRP